MDTPIYKAIKRQVTSEIADGTWGPGSGIPTEQQLAERFNVSVGTVRKAIDELVAEKIVVRRQGSGTFVTTHGQTRLLFDFFRVFPRQGERQYPETHTLDFRESIATSAESLKLAIPPGSKVCRIRNLRLLGGNPIITDDLVLPRPRFQDLSEQIFTRRPSTIYNLYQTRYGMNILRTSDRLRAVPADRDVARLLGLRKGAPILEICRVSLTYNDVPVEVRRSCVNSEAYEYHSELGKEN